MFFRIYIKKVGYLCLSYKKYEPSSLKNIDSSTEYTHGMPYIFYSLFLYNILIYYECSYFFKLLPLLLLRLLLLLLLELPLRFSMPCNALSPKIGGQFESSL